MHFIVSLFLIIILVKFNELLEIEIRFFEVYYMEIVRVEHLNYQIGRKKILQDISLKINQGENQIILGLNGSGKTTLLSILAGYCKCDNCEIELFGERVTPMNIDNLRTRIGFVSGSYFNKYYHNESALSIVLSGIYGHLGIHNSVNAKYIRTAKHLLKMLAISDDGRYPYFMLSRGQQQKVLIARALICKPEILLLDEPCEGLDIFSREQFFEMLNWLTKECNVTVILVSHYMEEILPFFKTATLIKLGRIHSQGKLETVFSDNNMSDFFGEPVKVRYIQNRWEIGLKNQVSMDKLLWEELSKK